MKPFRDPLPPDVTGARCFIVGNGKSLEPDQLDRVKGEVTFGVNRIHLVYDRTDWRPTYWFLTDIDGRKVYVEDIPFHSKQGYKCYVRCDIMARCIATWLGVISNEEMLELLNNVNPLDAVNHIQLDKRTSREPWIDGKYNQGGSVAAAQQLALAWGFNPVYMIGCEGFGEHFDPAYTVDRTPEQTQKANELLQIADEIALREYRARGVEIFNATVGGSKRTAIPTVDFWRLF